VSKKNVCENFADLDPPRCAICVAQLVDGVCLKHGAIGMKHANRTGTIEDQPLPIAQPERVPAWDLVIADIERHAIGTGVDITAEVVEAAIADMRDRDRVGRERYGVPLTTHNGRDHLVDAYQEALDTVVYMRAYLEEGERDGLKPSEMGMRVYVVAIINALQIRGMVLARDRAR
jgi:hypothetical protein